MAPFTCVTVDARVRLNKLTQKQHQKRDAAVAAAATAVIDTSAFCSKLAIVVAAILLLGIARGQTE